MIKTLILLTLLAVTACGETYLDDGTDLTAFDYAGYGVVDTALWITKTEAIWVNNAPDSTTHWICGQVTIYVLDRLVCDTVNTYFNYNEFIADTTGGVVPQFKLEITCDSIYVMKIKDVWCPYLDIRLDSVQHENLMELLNLGR